MRSPLLSKGKRTRAASARVCAAMEMATARRLMRRARFSNCGSPSTRQLCKEPKSGSGTRGASRVITHLQENFLRVMGRELRRRPPEVAAEGRLRARRDVRCARPLCCWTPWRVTSAREESCQRSANSNQLKTKRRWRAICGNERTSGGTAELGAEAGRNQEAEEREETPIW
jgi:hypothetical protein